MWQIFDDDDDNVFPLRSTPLPDEMFLLGKDAGNQYIAMQVDSDDRLVVQLATPEYVARGVDSVSNSVTEIYGTAGNYISEINILNRNSSAVLFEMWWDTSSSVSAASQIFVQSIPAYSTVQWLGMLEIDTKTLYGQAGTASSITLHLVIHKGRHINR